MSFTVNWFQPDQTELEFVQVETRSTWTGHATVYPVDKTAVQAEIPIKDAEKLHWEVRAYYLSDMNRGKLIAVGDAFGGIQEPPPSNLRIVLNMGNTGNPNAETCVLFISNILPKITTDSIPPTGFYILNKTAPATFYLKTKSFPYSTDPIGGFFQLNATVNEDGTVYASIEHSVYGTVGGDNGMLFEPISIPISTYWTAGTITVQL